MSKRILLLFVCIIITMQTNFAMESQRSSMGLTNFGMFPRGLITPEFNPLPWAKMQRQHLNKQLQKLESNKNYLNEQLQKLESNKHNLEHNNGKLVQDIQKNKDAISRNEKIQMGVIATGMVAEGLTGGLAGGALIGIVFGAGTIIQGNNKDLSDCIELNKSKLNDNNQRLNNINHDAAKMNLELRQLNEYKIVLEQRKLAQQEKLAQQLLRKEQKTSFDNYYSSAEDDTTGKEIIWRTQDLLVPIRQKGLSFLEWVQQKNTSARAFVNETIRSYMDPDYSSLKILSQKYDVSNFEDLLIKDSTNNTILHRACLDGDIENIKIICQIAERHQIDLLSQPNNDGFLPIHIAVANNCVPVIDIFIQMQKNAGRELWELIAHCGNENRYTALHVAANNGNIEAATILINNLTNDKILEFLLMQDRYNLTALQNAQGEGHIEFVKIITEYLQNQIPKEVLLNIIQQNFDCLFSFEQSFLMKEDSIGNTVLHFACKQNDFDSIVKICKLLDQDNMKKLIFHPNTSGFMPIHVAAEQENVEIVELFMRIAEINMLDYLTINSEIDFNSENRTKIFNFLKDVCFKQVECSVCWEETNGSQYYTLNCCNDKICKECLFNHLTTCLDKGSLIELICPNQNCLKTIEEPTMRAITLNNKALYNCYLDTGLNDYLNGDLDEYLNGNKQKECQQKQCPSPDCPNRFIPDPDCNEIMACDGCKNQYCSYCLFKHNLSITCEQAKTERDDIANEANMAWIIENTMQCARCGNAVERNQGCNHMTCKCGYEFCYVCGKVWGSLSCPFYNHPPV